MKRLELPGWWRRIICLALVTAGLVVSVLVSNGEARSAPALCTGTKCQPCATRPVGPRLSLPRRLPHREIHVPILMYHRINVTSPTTPAISRALTVHPADFERQMRWLKRRGFHTITQRQLFAALMHGRPLGRRPIMITFDDGYRDAYYKAAPVLSKLGMRATAYVISSRIVNGDRTFLSWGLLRRLERLGIEIGSHTVSHRDLTRLSDRELFEELVQSRRALERGLCHPVPWLAYPFGAHNERVKKLARRAGYVLAVTTQDGAFQAADQPLGLRRIRVLDTTGVRGLASLLGASVS
jgi:peptidoglycan/xylan/chitin deacetylase (PgdA/CDA1 family)